MILFLSLLLLLGSASSQQQYLSGTLQNSLFFNVIDPADDFSGPDGAANQYAYAPSLDLSGAQELSIELWAWWNTLNPSAQPQPLFYYFHDDQNGLGLSPINSTGEFDTPGLREDPVASLVTTAVAVEERTVLGPPGVGGDIRWVHYSLSLASDGSYRIEVYDSDDGDVTAFTGTSALRPANFTGTAQGLFMAGWNQTALTPPFAIPFRGKLSELRIWSRALSPTEQTDYRLATLRGDELGLEAYWRLDEPLGATSWADSTGNGHTAFAGPQAPVVRDGIQQSTLGQVRMAFVPLSTVYRLVAFDGNVSRQLVGGEDNIPFDLRLDNSGTSAALCAALLPSGRCDPAQLIPVAFPGMPGSVQEVFFAADRATCGRVNQFQLVVNTAANGDAVHNQEWFIEIEALAQPTISTSQPIVVPTTGGAIQIDGTGFGLDGPLDASESLSLCSGGVVSNGGTRLTCTVQPGIGQPGLTMSLCNRVFVYPGLLAYAPPTLSGADAVSFDLLRVQGTNLGPLGSPIAALTLEGGEPPLSTQCASAVITNAHTDLECTSFTTPLHETTNATLLCTIGGQTAQLQVNISICTPPCLNGGLCVPGSLCNCDQTTFSGQACEVPRVCTPECQNGGLCVRSSADGSNVCDCSESGGFGGLACDDDGQGGGGGSGVSGGAVAGIVVAICAGGTIVGAIILVVAMRSAREKHRGAPDWVPATGRDFSVLAYGDWAKATSEIVGMPENGEQFVSHLLARRETLFALANLCGPADTELDTFARAIMIIFQSYKLGVDLLEDFIRRDIEATDLDQIATLFRANDTTSKLFRSLFMIVAMPYLYDTVGPEISEIIYEGRGLEIDPDKMESDQDLNEMRWLLMAQTQKIFKQIVRSGAGAPPELRRVIHFMEPMLAEKFPNNTRNILGGFLFLRLFCPLVTAPERFMVVDEPPTPEARRLLILITKVLQNLSNDIEFGNKEPYMVGVNDFIRSNRDKLGEFYASLTKDSSSQEHVTPIEIPRHVHDRAVAWLATFVRERRGKLDQETWDEFSGVLNFLPLGESE